jgi:ataxin-3
MITNFNRHCKHLCKVRSTPHIGGFIPQGLDVSISPDPSEPTGEVDPVAASMERNRLLLQRMREQQEFAQRELWSEDEVSPEEQAAQEDRRTALRRQEEEEERELRRAIEESEALARQHAAGMARSTERVRPHDHEPQPSFQGYPSSPPPLRKPPTRGLPDSDSEDDEMPEAIVTHEEPVQAELTVEEIRQARLARFAQ